MTSMITAEAAKKLLDGTTPGPWEADGDPWNRIIWSSAENRVCFMAHSNGLNDDQDMATSRLVAAAPDLARALIASEAARKLAEERLAKAMEGLRLIELIGYREGEKIGWINAHMRGVATDTLSGKSIDHYWRFFPKHRHCPNLVILKEIDTAPSEYERKVAQMKKDFPNGI